MIAWFILQVMAALFVLRPLIVIVMQLGVRWFDLRTRSLLTLRRLMSYIYGAPILDVSRSHTTTQHSR